MKATEFSLFLDVLIEFRGNFLHNVSDLVSQHIHGILNQNNLNQRYMFENLDGDCLKHEPFDSENLIDLCKLNS